MADVIVNGNGLKVTAPIRMTNGSKNTYLLSFEFSEEWEGLTKVAMFRTEKSVAVFTKIDENNECIVPWEVLMSYDTTVLIEVCGTQDDVVVLPTIWAQLGPVQQGLTSSAAFPASLSGGSGGTDDHRLLLHREDPDQHTLDSISGLTEVVKTIPPPAVPLSNSEIEEIIKGVN